MHRSSSYYLQSSSSTAEWPSPAAGVAASGPSGTAGVMDVNHLPTYDPRSDAAKKEALDASRADLARTLVHLIPVVVLLCGLLIWSLSNADVPEVGVLVEKGNVRHTMVMQDGGAASSWKGSGMKSTTEDTDPIGKAHGTKRRVLRSEM
ncbi:hypothetical protein BAE44_0018126 [Dichanthelium oligosanthes]|uniref:Transmembrane protein n=1 Tax=Dichanthelium oligosanthes TaxID=888268 RepID=A0A1E5V793_9POAL|nr:hypothetical protein BAE44_0018126 [Dichanthelium oligosanthes]